MKVSCSSWSYHRTFAAGQIDHKGWIRACGEELRLDGVELLDVHFPSTDKKYLKEVKKLCADLGLSIAAISACNSFTTADVAARRQQIDHVKAWADRAAYLGAPVLRCFAGEAHGLTDASIWDATIEALREVTEYAADQYGIVLGMENHGGFSADQVLRMIGEIDHPYFKLTLDLGNFPSDPYTSIERTVGYAAFVHAKCYGFDAEFMDTTLDYGRIAEILQGAKYNGFLSLEYEGPGPELVEIPKGARLLKNLVAKAHMG